MVDILIVAALRKELNPVIELFRAKRVPKSRKDPHQYYEAEVSTGSGSSYSIRFMKVGHKGPAYTASALSDGVRRWQPTYVVVVGIAATIPGRKYRIGDVLIANQIVDLSEFKVLPTKKQIRANAYPCEDELVNATEDFIHDNQLPLDRYHVGAIISQTSLVKSAAFRNWLVENVENLFQPVGIEMEGGGVGARIVTLPKHARPGFVVIKGACDFANYHKNDVAQKRAARRSAEFVRDFLAYGPIPSNKGRIRKKTKEQNRQDQTKGFPHDLAREKSLAIAEERPFTFEKEGKPKSELLESLERLRLELERHGTKAEHKEYNQEGAGIYAARRDEDSQIKALDRSVFLAEPVTRRQFFKFAADDGKAFLAGLGVYAISEYIENPPEINKLLTSEIDWATLEPYVKKAIDMRDFELLDHVAEDNKDNLFLRHFLRSIAAHIQGDIGMPYDLYLNWTGVRKGTTPQFLRHLPANLEYFFYTRAARVFSVAGHPDLSVDIWTSRIPKLKIYSRLSETDQVYLWREELNHRIQTAGSRNAYYSANGPVLRFYDDKLRRCLMAMRTMDLAKARQWNEKLGPAVICMYEYRQVIDYLRDGNKEMLTKSIDNQLKAIRVLCEVDHTVGPTRYSPLAGQHIRAGNWDAAWDVLQEQEAYYQQGEDPIISNVYQWAISQILKAIILSRRPRADYDLAELCLANAETAAEKTKTTQFRDIIGYLKREIENKKLNSTKVATAAQIETFGNPYTKSIWYYFFGVD